MEQDPRELMDPGLRHPRPVWNFLLTLLLVTLGFGGIIATMHACNKLVP